MTSNKIKTNSLKDRERHTHRERERKKHMSFCCCLVLVADQKTDFKRSLLLIEANKMQKPLHFSNLSLTLKRCGIIYWCRDWPRSYKNESAFLLMYL